MMKTQKFMCHKTTWKKIAAAVFWLVVWQLAALWADLPIFFPTPLRVINTLWGLMRTSAYWRSILYTMIHIVAGFGLAAFIAVGLAVLSACIAWFDELISLPMLAIRSVPVVSFIILALICFRSAHLALLISFLMVLPILYAAVLRGIRQMDRKMEEMAQLFRIRPLARLRYVYIPQVLPYFKGACASAMGIAWKSGTAAEVIGMPSGSIGEKLQQAKTFLMTPELFAWTVTIVAVSLLWEKAGLKMIDLIEKSTRTMRRSGGRSAANDHRYERENAALSHVTKAFGEKKVLNGWSLKCRSGETTVLMGRSGIGKTTVLRLLTGLEKPDDGEVQRPAVCSVVFQEDRLIDHLSALDNVLLVCPGADPAEVSALLREMGLETEDQIRPVGKLSGGMKRRCTLARALTADGMLLLDEPFTGLDAQTAAEVKKITAARIKDRTTLLITHSREDAGLLGGEIVHF